MFKKKSLGQHFLRSASALHKIAEAGRLSPEDTVLEVGPGEGVLTALLLALAGKVVAVEKDDRLIPVLTQKFAREIAEGKLRLIHADILTLSPTNYLLLTPSYKVVANIPYYITGALIRKFLESERQPSAMVLLLQKEVAKRIVASDKKESILSISVKAYGAPRYIDTVKAGSFSPPPKVDSGIIAIEGISKNFFEGISEQIFFETLKKGFSHPRKLLSSNLRVTRETLIQCDISATARAENVSCEQWFALARGLNRCR
ncbi:MAG: ribosomal RNA small subunit methyltransferase A [Candidatus Taylorbacteria bacterium]|nr:ribosomal RNA small subunit methyltransferase A [Candidatus Taylorbacteria bacterium]